MKTFLKELFEDGICWLVEGVGSGKGLQPGMDSYVLEMRRSLEL